MNIKKSYKFAFKSSLLIAISTFIITGLFTKIFHGELILASTLLISLFVLFCSFLVIQLRAQHFIYKRVKNIYDEVSIFNVEEIKKNSITTDMETLSKEVKKFAEDKKLQIEMLQIREEYRREFLGNVSHELKTPLFTVQGYLLTLKDGAIKDKSIRDKYLERANKGVDRLINIVKDLDMIAQLESGNLNPTFETFNIIWLVQNVFDLLEIKAKKREVILTFDKKYENPILVKGDVERIEQVLINLIENSIKYGRLKGNTIVSVKNYSPEQYIINVTDNGEGIKEENISRLFERFYRVDQSRSRGQGGSGLGLSIVKHIIEAHQQQVFVESEIGKGSSFSFTLEKFK